MNIQFTIWTIPIPKGRPRFYKRGRFMGTYTPAKTRQFEKLVRQEALVNQFNSPLDCAVAVKLKFFLPIPKSFSKKKRQQAIAGELRPITRPDIDNLIKALIDPLNDIFFKDDRQIVSISAEKYCSDKPRIDIEISEVQKNTS